MWVNKWTHPHFPVSTVYNALVHGDAYITYNWLNAKEALSKALLKLSLCLNAWPEQVPAKQGYVSYWLCNGIHMRIHVLSTSPMWSIIPGPHPVTYLTLFTSPYKNVNWEAKSVTTACEHC